jgi:hypothetical protein
MADRISDTLSRIRKLVKTLLPRRQICPRCGSLTRAERRERLPHISPAVIERLKKHRQLPLLPPVDQLDE